MVATETYKPDDADMSVQIGRINAAGAGAIIKMGQGGSTVTIAKNIKQLGLDKMLLLASIDDGATSAGGRRGSGRALPVRWRRRRADARRDPRRPGPRGGRERSSRSGGRNTAIATRTPERAPGTRSMVIAKAVETAKSFDGPGVRDAVEKIAALCRAPFAPIQLLARAARRHHQEPVRDRRRARRQDRK